MCDPRPVRIWQATVFTAISAAAACGDPSVVLRVDGNLSVPQQIDGICLAVFDRDAGGGEFSRFYPLVGDNASLPQTLTVDPGQAQAAVAVVRGYAGGVESDRAVASFEFAGTDEVPLRLGACGDGGRISGNVATAAIPGGAAVAVSFGRGGSRIVAIGAGDNVSLVATGDRLDVDAAELPAGPAVAPNGLVAFDADGDCDDDLLLLFDGASPMLWRRDGAGFVDASDQLTGAPAATAAAAIDADGDGDIDLVLGSAAAVTLLRNDGSGHFQVDSAAVPAGAADDVTALATGDIDGDGHPDIIIGRGSATAVPMRVLLNDPSGTGSFELAEALPAVSLKVRGLAVADVDGDAARDLVVASDGDNVRLYINRGGLLEDKSFVLLPNVDPVMASALAVADWNDACGADIAVMTPSQTILWPAAGGGFTEGSTDAPVGRDVIAADVNDDGAPELLVVSDSEVTWVRR